MADQPPTKQTVVDMPPVTTLVIARDMPTAATNDTTAQTPGRLPNVIIKTITPFGNIAVRGLRTFIQTLLGILSAGTVAPTLLHATDFWHLFLTAASLSVAATVISVLQNTVELLAKFDQTSPVLRG